MSTFSLAAKDAAEHVIGARGKKVIKYGLLRARMALGAEPFTSNFGIDRAVLEHLPTGPGFFVEAGCNDGFSNSDTFYLETRRGWRGILVDPLAELAGFARRIRKASVYHAALGAPELRGETVTLNFNDSTSAVVGRSNVTKWGGMLGRNPRTASAKVQTISDILEQEGDPQVDFFSLDVEGYELEVLKGLDLKRHVPSLMVVETEKIDAVMAALEHRYEVIGRIHKNDYLLRLL